MSEDLREGREPVKQTWKESVLRRKKVLRLEDKHGGQGVWSEVRKGRHMGDEVRELIGSRVVQGPVATILASIGFYSA